jgi:hypothetical protein
MIICRRPGRDRDFAAPSIPKASTASPVADLANPERHTKIIVEPWR